jgi:hypothetical protein
MNKASASRLPERSLPVATATWPHLQFAELLLGLVTLLRTAGDPVLNVLQMPRSSTALLSALPSGYLHV